MSISLVNIQRVPHWLKTSALPVVLYLLLERGFYWFTDAVRIFFPLVTIKFKWSQVWGLLCVGRTSGFVCVGVFISLFLLCTETFQDFASVSDIWEQLYAFLSPLSLPLSVYITPGWWEYASSPPLLLTTPNLFMADSGKKSGEQESVWVFGNVSLTSLPLFQPSELELTKLSSVLPWSQEDFAAGKISFPSA